MNNPTKETPPPLQDLRRLVNPSPKSRFMESGQNISEHRQLVDSRPFIRGVDFALAEYSAVIVQGMADGNQAAAVAIKLRGVHEFLQTFRLLSETVPAPRVIRAQDNLPDPAKS